VRSSKNVDNAARAWHIIPAAAIFRAVIFARMDLMKFRILTLLFVAAASLSLLAANEPTQTDKPQEKGVAPVLDFTMKSLDGKSVNLSQYQGKVLLIVNTASKCGFTPQYKELEAVYSKYKDQGFMILGFPANDYGGQEPGSDADIKTFCTENYGVTFDMFSKVHVKGDEKAPLFHFLTDEKTDAKFPGEIKWNFEKFLISKDGQIVSRFRSAVKPSSDEMNTAIQAELKK
jgi:glutathione peroxidase